MDYSACPLQQILTGFILCSTCQLDPDIAGRRRDTSAIPSSETLTRFLISHHAPFLIMFIYFPPIPYHHRRLPEMHAPAQKSHVLALLYHGR